MFVSELLLSELLVSALFVSVPSVVALNRQAPLFNSHASSSATLSSIPRKKTVDSISVISSAVNIEFCPAQLLEFVFKSLANVDMQNSELWFGT
jgi:hypothetical protein